MSKFMQNRSKREAPKFAATVISKPKSVAQDFKKIKREIETIRTVNVSDVSLLTHSESGFNLYGQHIQTVHMYGIVSSIEMHISEQENKSSFRSFQLTRAGLPSAVKCKQFVDQHEIHQLSNDMENGSEVILIGSFEESSFSDPTLVVQNIEVVTGIPFVEKYMDMMSTRCLTYLKELNSKYDADSSLSSQTALDLPTHVKEYINQSTDDEGESLDRIMSYFLRKGMLPAEVNVCIAKLIQDGEVYETIDSEHFKAV
jgi:hypothetical protein